MLLGIEIFVAGLACGGLLIFLGMNAALKRELAKRPWTEQEKAERAALLVEAEKLRDKTDDVSRERFKEINDYLVMQDVQRDSTEALDSGTALTSDERNPAREYQRMAMVTAIIFAMRQKEFPSIVIDAFERNVDGMRDQSVDAALAWARTHSKADIIDVTTLWAAAAAWAENAEELRLFRSDNEIKNRDSGEK
jgi:hypothetical protein